MARQEQQGCLGGISLSPAWDAAVLGKALKLCSVFFLGFHNKQGTAKKSGFPVRNQHNLLCVTIDKKARKRCSVLRAVISRRYK